MASDLLKSPSASSAFSLGTVVFVLFKHKWKILLTTLLATGAAAAYYFRSAPTYLSEAKILVKYVMDRDAIDGVETTSSLATGGGGEGVIKSQVDIITSWDLAVKVAEKIGPENGGPAAGTPSVIARGLTATAEKGGSVITVTFKNSDPALTKPVVDELVRQYFIQHQLIHRDAESLSIIVAAVGEADTNLSNLDRELKKKKDSNLPLAQLTSSNDAELARVTAELESAKVGLAEQQAWVDEVQRYVSGTGGTAAGSPAPSVTKPHEPGPVGVEPGESAKPTPPATPAAAEPSGALKPAGPQIAESGNPAPSVRPESGDTAVAVARASPAPGLDPGKAPGEAAASTPNNAAPAPAVPDAGVPVRDKAVVAAYEALMTKISMLQTTSASLLKFTPENQQVKDYEARLASLQSQRIDMETKFPYLQTAPVATGGSAPVASLDLMSERKKLVELEAKIKALTPVQAALLKKSQTLANDASLIAKLERDREGEQKSYDQLVASKVKADSNSKVTSGKTPGLAVIQKATPAALDTSKRDKTALAIAAAGPVAGAVLVIIFGLLLNRTIKRPVELEEQLGVPLMMTIPRFSRRARRRLDLPAPGDAGSLSTPWRQGHFIRPFAESIRDRLGLYFERNKLTRKPKLIGVTGFTKGAGVSALAGGLAAALSEVGDGRVLLVDMNVANGKAHSFSEGLPVLSLKNALKDDGKLQSTAENLYLARAENADPGAGSMLLKKLFELMPNLKASEFDYMVFDLPLLSQTSPAAAMGGLMDSVLVVVEAEANAREEVKRGHRDLIASGANVSMIFNKARTYGPRALVGAV